MNNGPPPDTYWHVVAVTVRAGEPPVQSSEIEEVLDDTLGSRVIVVEVNDAEPPTDVAA